MRARSAPRRGAVLPLVCILLVALLGAAALAVDLGRLYYVRQELQTAADAAALAAMRTRQLLPVNYRADATAAAQQAAAAAAARNRAAGAGATVAAADVLPMAYEPATRAITGSTWHTNTSAVQVTAEARPNYVLAGALGLTAPVMRRTSTAWLANVNGANCVRPIAINYTRFYEEGVTHDTRYSATGLFAPEFDLWDIANTRLASLPQRTFIVLPPNARKDYWMSQRPDSSTSRGYGGFHSHVHWQPLDFGSSGNLWTYGLGLAGPDGSSWCSANRLAVGDVRRPIVAASPGDSSDLIQATNLGMAYLCNRSGNANNAHCFNSAGTVGVKTRIVLTDSVAANGAWTHRVREVGVARVMCYFRSRDDVCNDYPMAERDATGTWSYFGPYKGYPAGTVILFLDTPGSTRITRDVVLGNKPGLTQRLLLVR